MGALGTGGLWRGALLLLSLQAPQLLGGQGEGGGVTLHCTEEGGVEGGVPKGMDQVSGLTLSHCSASSLPSLLSSLEGRLGALSSLALPHLRGGSSRESTHRCSPCVTRLSSVQFSSSTLGQGATGLLEWFLRCSTSLHTVDLSSSQLSSLPTLRAASHITLLNVTSNSIEEISPSSLSSLPHLASLDLSGNKLVKLPSGLFRSCKKLRSLQINQNLLSFVQRQSFLGLQRLERLGLANNDLSSRWLGGEVFSHLHGLRELDLSNNRLTSLGSLLSGLPNLRSLHASHNHIERLGDLKALQQLEELNLSHNSLIHLEALGSIGLQRLDLSHNQLARIEGEVFANLSLLQEINLKGNLLEILPGFLSSVPLLESLNLVGNKISTLGREQITAPSLQILNLGGNLLRTVPEEAFRGAPNVRELDISKNQLRTLEKGMFEPLAKLEVLILDSNQLEDINGVLSSLPVLKQLSISNNSLKWFDMAFFPKSLEVMNLKNNLIDLIGNYYKMLEDFSLVTLDLSSNRIAFLEPQIFVDSLREINLEANNISEIGTGTFFGLQHLRKVDLRSNALWRLPQPSLKISNLSSPPQFQLSSNPLLCDCSLEWLLPSSSSLPGPDITDRDSLTCTPHPTEATSLTARPLPLASVPPSLLLCHYTEHCFSLCRCCTFLACDCRMKCPDPCSCYHDQAWSLNMIQCSARGLTDVPREIPMDSTVVFLDGNNLGLLGPEVFLGRNKVSTVHLNHSRITGISNGSLAGLNSLKVLFLNHNQIRELSGEEFLDVQELEVLHLHHNLLFFVSNTSFTSLTMLRELTLHSNQLTSLSLPPALSSVTVQGNPWLCSCELATTLERLRPSHPPVTCSRSAAVGAVAVPLPDLSSSCKTRSVLAVSSPDTSSPLIVLLISVAVVVLVLVALTAVLLFVRRPLASWLAAKSTPWLQDKLTEPSLYSAPLASPRSPGSNTEYSAYLHYCLHDSQYVQQRLAPGLQEASPGSRLCLHHRDLQTDTTVGQALAGAVQQSRCLIILASQAYFDSSIPSYELQMIMSEVLKRANYPVVVMSREEATASTRARLREIVGLQADTWTYQPLSQQLDTWDQLGIGSSSSSSQSSGSTRSTAASTPSMRTLPGRPRGRLIENPLDCQYSVPLLQEGENIYHTIGEGGRGAVIDGRSTMLDARSKTMLDARSMTHMVGTSSTLGPSSRVQDRLIINKHLDIVKLREAHEQ